MSVKGCLNNTTMSPALSLGLGIQLATDHQGKTLIETAKLTRFSLTPINDHQNDR